jgi:hypothetical protein
LYRRWPLAVNGLATEYVKSILRLLLPLQLAPQMLRQLPDGRKVEQLRQVYQPRILMIDPLVDLDKLQ